MVHKIAYDVRRQRLSAQTHQFVLQDIKVAICIVYPEDGDLPGPPAIVLYAHARHIRAAIGACLAQDDRIPAEDISGRAFGSRIHECDISLYGVISPVGCSSHLGDRVIAIRGGGCHPEIVVAAEVYMQVPIGRRPYSKGKITILEIILEFVGHFVFGFCPVLVHIYIV